MRGSGERGRRGGGRWSVVALLGVHAVLLMWIGARISPTLDEVGHLPAGLYVWRFGRFDLYRVNPPLVRMAAAWPVALSGAKTDWTSYREGPRARPEWTLGRDFIRANDDGRGGWFGYFVVARWALVPLLLVGAYVCYRWARDLYGRPAGLLALVFWCFSPTVLGWGSTLCPDAPAAAMGVAAGYLFWKWLRRRDWGEALLAGIMLGVAALSKLTWIVLFGVWPVLWLVFRVGGVEPAAWAAGRGVPSGWRRESLQLAGLLLVAVYTIHTGYGFEGSFKPLGEYVFVSRTFAGPESVTEGGSGGNRFAGTWLAGVPAPLPENYLRGIDLQKRDFERRKWSYLAGEWKQGGWWHYYLVCVLLKVPLGAWVLGWLALGLTLSPARERAAGLSRGGQVSGGVGPGWADELVLWAPAVVVFVLVSSQTGFNRYLRYVLPCFPFMMVWTSKVAGALAGPGRGRAVVVVAGAAAWAVASSLWVYPHSMSYFNELAGGPHRGERWLLDANIDWGQDLWYVKRWLDAHPEARPYCLEFHGFVEAEHFGFRAESEPPPGPAGERGARPAGRGDSPLGPKPGWHVISVHAMHTPPGLYLYFLQFRPVATAGYSMRIYHISREEANRVRRAMGLGEIR